MVHFEARLSRGLRVYTWLFFMALASFVVVTLVRQEYGVVAPLAAISLGVFVVGVLFAVRGYDFDDGELVIERIGRKTYVDLANLVDAEVDPKLVRRSISLWSTRGLFGFIGYGYSGRIGSYRAYVTNPSKAVVLRFSSGNPVVVSPENPDEFRSTVLDDSRSRKRQNTY